MADQVTVPVKLIQDLQWMARRYADGRMSYAVGLLNDHTRTLEALGVPLEEPDGTAYAKDGMKSGSGGGF